ncbi:hypothetical protein PCASD_25075 [Puccinia coronata f. sp. avenae]|uniref:Uncharacterized protein n=1 Tax=Puccinia coronata f. sp. avenae TaxID=200324 RepID=A0A2N5TM30_9BASI|nr:hypothetical protein PCASD_25075 [Puccinia coronata f. sp. avenae]
MAPVGAPSTVSQQPAAHGALPYTGGLKGGISCGERFASNGFVTRGGPAASIPKTNAVY